MSRYYQNLNSNRNINDFDLIKEIDLAAKAGCEHDLNDPYYKPLEKEIFYYPNPELTEVAKIELSKIPQNWLILCSMNNDIVQFHESGGFHITIAPNINLNIDFSDDGLKNNFIVVSDYDDFSDEGLKFFNNMEDAIKHISNIRRFLILK